MVRPGDHLLDRILLALGQDLDAPVGAVLDPPGNPEASRFALGCCTEKDAGHPAVDDEMDSLRGHDAPQPTARPRLVRGRPGNLVRIQVPSESLSVGQLSRAGAALPRRRRGVVVAHATRKS